jgi:hypothetical protein
MHTLMAVVVRAAATYVQEAIVPISGDRLSCDVTRDYGLAANTRDGRGNA